MLAWVVVAVLAYSLATLYHSAPAVLDCNSKTMGAMGDGTSGGVWLAWAFQENGGSPFRDTSTLTAAPIGERFWQPEWYSQTLLYTPMWALSHVVSPVCSYNITTHSGFLLSGVAMFGLVYWLTRHGPISVVAGYAFAFSPFALQKAGGHAAYVHQEWFPALLLALLVLASRRTPRRAIAAGVLLGVTGYFDGYYLLFSWLLFGTVLATLVTRELLRQRAHGSSEWRSIVKYGALTGAVGAVLLVPLAAAYMSSSESVEDGITRNLDELNAYSAEPLDYLLPARNNPVFGDNVASIRDDRLGRSNSSETTLFVGWVTIALAVPAVVLTRRQLRENGSDALTQRAALAMTPLLATAAVLAFVSGPATWKLPGVDIPGPSRVINAVAPYWRVYSRLFVPVHAALIAAASIGAAYLVRRFRPTPRHYAVVSILALFAVVEKMPNEPLSYAWFDYGAAPTGYQHIAEQDDVDVIAEYPLLPVSMQPNSDFATWQPVHGKAVVNPKTQPNERNIVNSHLVGLGDPQTFPLLRTLGVDMVVVHKRQIKERPLPPLPAGLRIDRDFSFQEQARTSLTSDQARRARSLRDWYDMTIYRVEPGPLADSAVFPLNGFSGYEINGWSSGRWIVADTATFTVWTLEDQPGREITTRMHLHTFHVPREVTITQGGRVLWQGRVTPKGRVVEFVAQPGELELTTDIGPQQISEVEPSSKDDRHVSVFVSQLDATEIESSRDVGSPKG